MRRALILAVALVIFLGAFGCIEQKDYPSVKNEQLSTTNSVDLDKDGIPDLSVYNFAPVTVTGTDLTVQRQLGVAVRSTATFSTTNQNLTDLDLLTADSNLEEFSKSKDQAVGSCSQAIGLFNVVCSDTETCSRLCSSNSVKCKKIAASYQDVLAGSMIGYIQNVNEISSLTLDMRRMVTGLRTGTAQDKEAYLDKSRALIEVIAQVETNPLYTSQDLNLCSNGDFGVSYLTDAIFAIGTYTSERTNYHYTVVISVKPSDGADAKLSQGIGSLAITDKIPKSVVPNKEAISSVQTLTTSDNANSLVMSWAEAKPSDQGRVFVYEFDSATAPDVLIASLASPAISVKSVNLVWLAPTNILFNAVYGLSKNYFFALGMAIGATIAVLLLVYNIAILLFTLISEKTAGAGLSTAFRRAFGRTEIRWKSDLALSVIALVAGYYLSGFVATQPETGSTIVDSLDILLANGVGMVAAWLVLAGTILIYFAIENIVKITLLEMSYGKILKAEKDTFVQRANEVKERIKALSDLIDAYREEDFDISREYDVLTTVNPQKIDDIVKSMTPRTKAMLDDYSIHIDGAISTLKERKKLADESWPRWKDSITKTLEEHDEVYASNLVTIPASLRLWALSKYVAEKKSEGLVFEHDALRKKRIDPATVVKDMITRRLIRGAIVIQEEKITISEFADGNATLRSALAMKLRTYLYSLTKNIAQREPSRFLSVGNKSVLLFFKGRASETMLFLDKDRVKEAIEGWNSKMAPGEAGASG